jgi:hypothetical protein
MPLRDSQGYFAGYAYFGVLPDYLINSAGAGLSSLDLAYATT